MELVIRKNVNELYYLSCRMGDNCVKSFVRVSYRKKDGSLGSKLYCSSKLSGLLFENKEDALKLKNKYKGQDKVKVLDKLESRYYYKDNNGDYKKLGIELKEVVVEGIKCYEVKYVKN